MPTKTAQEIAEATVDHSYTPRPGSALALTYRRLPLDRSRLLRKIIELALTEGYGYFVLVTVPPLRGDLPRAPVVNHDLVLRMDKEIERIVSEPGEMNTAPATALDNMAAAQRHFIHRAITALRDSEPAVKAAPAPRLPHGLGACLSAQQKPPSHMQFRAISV